MLKTRILLISISVIIILGLFFLPKVVIENDDQLAGSSENSAAEASDPHEGAPQELIATISKVRGVYLETSEKQKKAIFADSLASLYAESGKFDSAGWYAEEAAKFFNNEKSWIKAGDSYYQAYTFALETEKQAQLAEKTREYFTKVLDVNPGNLDVKTKMAMTYFSSANPMQGVMMLREVLKDDPKNESAMFNLGMLSLQSGQHDKAIERLKELVEINPNHVQGQLLLGMAYKESGDNKLAKEQFEKVKSMDKDPAVQAAVESYLKDLK